jgi:hypothetical protein
MIEIYNDGVRVARSTKAFNVIVTKELMRAYTLDAEFTNQDNSRQYITTSSTFKVDGQLFDIVGFQQNSGRGNTTKISADHVGYRLNNYKIPPLFSTMGTIAEIAQAILDESGASSEFTVGTCADLGSKAFSLGNEQETTCRSALFAMSALGVEMDFDNFTLNFPERVGSDTGKVFEFGKDLVDLNRVWDKGNGTTYDITIANLQRVPGHSGDEFELGDDVTVKDYFIGDSIKRRIVSYKKCLDKPTLDTVTLGVFVRDIFDDTADMAVKINQRIVEGQAYNGNRINRTEGFVSETNDGQKKVTMSGTEGFSAWVWENDAWVRKSWFDEMGIVTSKISNPNSDGTYSTIGKGPEEYDGYGLFVVHPTLGTIYELYPKNFGGVISTYARYKGDNVRFNKRMTIADRSFPFLSAELLYTEMRWESTTPGIYTAITAGVGGIEFEVDGSPYGHTENITISGRTLRFVNGILVSAS